MSKAHFKVVVRHAERISRTVCYVSSQHNICVWGGSTVIMLDICVHRWPSFSLFFCISESLTMSTKTFWMDHVWNGLLFRHSCADNTVYLMEDWRCHNCCSRDKDTKLFVCAAVQAAEYGWVPLLACCFPSWLLQHDVEPIRCSLKALWLLAAVSGFHHWN